MVIRKAVIEDASSIRELIRQLGYEIKASDVEKNITIYNEVKGHVLIAEENSNIIGFVSGAFIPLFHSNELMFRITALCVDQNSRSQGVGKHLINAIEEKCKDNNCFYLEVTSGAHRKEDAHLFYEKLSYKAYEGKRFRKTLEW
ncbi:MAG: GNAT family N-acetyltransferase [Pedobacter sp.]|nr:MAG: GNAT family N-acetyltransferase [Pedobacter sp.]